MNARIAQEFPKPTVAIRWAFDDLKRAASDDPAVKEKVGPASALPRPWDPAGCTQTLRRELWAWLDKVVGWINHEYCWSVDRGIPSCWPAHPYLVHEVAGVACLRYAAASDLTVAPMGEWHRTVLPEFLNRSFARLGGAPCQPGTHKQWPAAGRYTDFVSTIATERRSDLFKADITEASQSPATTLRTGVRHTPERTTA